MKSLKFVSLGIVALGVMLFAVGWLFKILELSDLWNGVVSGPIIFGIGLILLLISFLKSKKS